jgi:hypothetical protein
MPLSGRLPPGVVGIVAAIGLACGGNSGYTRSRKLAASAAHHQLLFARSLLAAVYARQRATQACAAIMPAALCPPAKKAATAQMIITPARPKATWGPNPRFCICIELGISSSRQDLPRLYQSNMAHVSAKVSARGKVSALFAPDPQASRH